MLNEAHPNLFEISRVQDVTVIRFTRRTILDPLLIEAVGERLVELVRNEGGHKMVLDLARVESLTSAMLGKFAALHNAVSEAGGKLVCCNVDPFLKQIFTVCKFPDAIPILADEPAAVAALGAS